MARGRDLAGLAALAGLAYMANRKDKEKENNKKAYYAQRSKNYV